MYLEESQLTEYEVVTLREAQRIVHLANKSDQAVGRRFGRLYHCGKKRQFGWGGQSLLVVYW